MSRRSADNDAMARGLQLGIILATGRRVTTALIRERFGVSAATAKRDMLAIEVTLRPEVAHEGEQQARVLTLDLSRRR